VLSAMVLEPLRWNERFGWRRLVEAERVAQFEFWREVARRMNIREIPETIAGLEALNREVEETRFAPTEAGRRLARSQLHVFLDLVPGVPERVGRAAVSGA